jgi:hypothetical protein
VNYITIANKSSMLLIHIKINSQTEMLMFTTKHNITRENTIFLIVNDRNNMYVQLFAYT